jgi:UDP-glucose 4-epimerase
MARKKVLLLGAAGLIAPHITQGLEAYYDLRLADVKPHPQGRPMELVDITCYDQVLEAARGMDGILNFTVNRPHPELSFGVNVNGAHHVLKAAVELGIRRIVHTGPQMVITDYQHDFGMDDPPLRPNTHYYGLTKFLSIEMCRIYAQTYGLQIACFLFNGLHPKPEGPVQGEDFPPFTIVWEDLVEVCRLGLEVEQLPGNFQIFDLHSYQGHGKFMLERAERLLGFKPQAPVEQLYARSPGPAGKA